MSNQHLTLSQLNGFIKEAIEMNFVEGVWVIAEVASLRRAGNGHCYMEWVEKQHDRVIAKNRAVCWSNTYQNLSSNFFKVTGTPIQEGMKVLFFVEITFHEVYGLSFQIKGIDPTYTLGEMARRKKEILAQLEKNGLLKRNARINLPQVIQKIAVISSEGAAGYEDFMNQMENNSFGFQFYYELFPATMQGDRTSGEVVSALKRVPVEFDVIVLIRGGGSSIDLNSFDDYAIGEAIANASIPVISGIGHERDETVPDFVAHTKVKTPTAAAEFIIEHNALFYNWLLECQSNIQSWLVHKMKDEKNSLKQKQKGLKQSVEHLIQLSHKDLKAKSEDSKRFIQSFLQKKNDYIVTQGASLKRSLKYQYSIKEKELVTSREELFKIIPVKLNGLKRELEFKEKQIHLNDPKKLLKKGYSLVYKNQQLIKDKKEVESGDSIEIITFENTYSAKVD